MADPYVNPRRRPQSSPASSPSFYAMGLKKGNTFHPRTHSVDQVSVLDQARYMPRRSPTCVKTLESLVIREADLIFQRQTDVAKLLQDFDDKINGLVSTGGDASILKEEEVHAIPSFIIQQANVPDYMGIDHKSAIAAEHQHASDSGLGSSVASSIGNGSLRSAGSLKSLASTSTTITRSATALSTTLNTEHFLSKDAVRHIKKHIVQPILSEKTLKEFHPLVEDVPRRIGAKFITNLRDLEKTLFFLAPDFASSPSSFLKFCETSIECLHTTVDYLSESDQRRPTDRPYTNNYFLDLVEQIRRYAEIMARTREKEASGQELDEMDYTPNEEISIEGGLSKNGKPAELVRKKDGKVIPLSGLSNLDAEVSPLCKRPLADVEMDEEAYRSMARRRKSEKPGDVMHSCRECDKQFKRPCDLSKHEKTHSRPWKCPDSRCRYHELGWPTEKERDRHMNDKHSNAPKMYRCKFLPCSYSSKRESNCKQHMEKTHNWTYVRSKSNGKIKKNAQNSPAESITPVNMTTPSFSGNQTSSPASSLMPSPPATMNNNLGYGTPFYTPDLSVEDLLDFNSTRRDSVVTAESRQTFSSGFSPVQPMQSTFEGTFFAPEIMSLSSAMFDNALLPMPMPMPAQQPTPATSLTNGCDEQGFAFDQQHLPSTGQANLPLFTPQMNATHFDEALGGDSGFGGDFTLFDSPSDGSSNLNLNTNVVVDPGVSMQLMDNSMMSTFPDTGTTGGQFDHFAFDAY